MELLPVISVGGGDAFRTSVAMRRPRRHVEVVIPAVLIIAGGSVHGTNRLVAVFRTAVARRLVFGIRTPWIIAGTAVPPHRWGLPHPSAANLRMKIMVIFTA